MSDRFHIFKDGMTAFEVLNRKGTSITWMTIYREAFNLKINDEMPKICGTNIMGSTMLHICSADFL